MRRILFRPSFLCSLPFKRFLLLSFIILSFFSFSSSSIGYSSPFSPSFLLHYYDSTSNPSLIVSSDSFSSTSLNVSSPAGLGLNFRPFLSNNSASCFSIAVDAQDNSYLTGATVSSNFTTKNAFQPVSGGGIDTFVAKFDSTGNLVYSTFLGGTGDDLASAIAVDSQGDSYITGYSSSSNFSTKNAYNSTYGEGGYRDAFVAKFDSIGTLLFSTFIGGIGNDLGSAIAVDSQGNSYITGSTSSSNFPTKNAFDSTYGEGGYRDAFVAKFNSTGNLVFSTFLGGTGDDLGSAIAVDSQGNSYITGSTSSSNFPTKNAFQPVYNDGGDGFVVKFDATGTLLFGTFLGGTSYDSGQGIAVDSQGNSYVTGSTGSRDFSTKNAYNSTYSGGTEDAFVAKFDATGNLVFSTFLGGDHFDSGQGIAVDSQGNSYVTGSTRSKNFPTKNAYDLTYAGFGSAFVAKFNSTGNLVYSTFLGIADPSDYYGIAIDRQGNSYLTGTGDIYVFIAKINPFLSIRPDSSTFSSLGSNSNFFPSYTFLSFIVLGIFVLVGIFTVVEYRKYLSVKTNSSAQNRGSFKRFLINTFTIKIKHKQQATNQLSDEIFKLLDEIEKENTPDK